MMHPYAYFYNFAYTVDDISLNEMSGIYRSAVPICSAAEWDELMDEFVRVSGVTMDKITVRALNLLHVNKGIS